MVIMASGIARGRVRTTTTTMTMESRKMAANLLQLILCWPRQTSHIFDIGHLYYGELTPVKTRYPLSSITWLYRRLKFKAHRGHVIFWSWPLSKYWCFWLDRGLKPG